MRDRSLGRQQEQNNERLSSNTGYEQTGTSREQQNQRGSQHSQQQSSNLGDKSRLSESESEPI